MLLLNGSRRIESRVFTEMTPPPGSSGGLANAIVGSLMSLAAVAVGTPIGILAGTYLAEYGRYGKFAFVPPASSTTSCCRPRRS
jgi:phosphate transport system permease protein